MSTQDSIAINQNEFASSIQKIRDNAIAMDIIAGLGGALLIGILSRISIPLWFTVVPFTGQTLGVVGCVIAMKRYRAILSMAFYILLSMAGLPLLASDQTGWGGISWLTKPVSEQGWLAGPTIGYIYGFLLASIICKLVIGERKTIGWMTLSAFITTLVIYICGVYWLHHVLNPIYGTPYFGGPNSAFALGCWPFLIGDLIKAMLGIGISRSYIKSKN